MLISTKVFIVLVQWVVRQMLVSIIQITIAGVLLWCETDQSIVKKEDLDRIDHGCYQYVDPEIKLVLLYQCRSFEILLDNKRGFFHEDRPIVLAVLHYIAILLCCVMVRLFLKVDFKLFLLSANVVEIKMPFPWLIASGFTMNIAGGSMLLCS